jgi:hypothetical protein
MQEIWKYIPQYDKKYQISDDGKIKSLINRYGNICNKILKPSMDRDGYLLIRLYKNQNNKTYKVHRLVLETFVGPCPLGMECRHIDDNRANNKLNNLRWGTHKENIQDSIQKGTHYCSGHRGSTFTFAKLNEKQVRIIKYLLKEGYLTQKEIAKIFDVNPRTISAIKNNISWNYIN